MMIGFDMRPLISPVQTGVGVYASNMAVSLARYAAGHGHTILIFVSGRSVPNVVWRTIALMQREGAEVITAHAFVPNILLHIFIWLFRLPRLDRLVLSIAGYAPDVWISPNSMFTALSPSIFHIQVVHDIAFALFPHFLSKKQRAWHSAVRAGETVRLANACIAVSETTKRDLARVNGIDPLRVVVFSPKPKEIFFSPASAESKKKVREKYGLPDKYILHVGTHEERKNVKGIIDAYAKSTLSSVGVHLVCAGYRSERISFLPEMAGFVHGVSFVSLDDLPALYALANLTVYSSWYEGYGLPVEESLLQGTPVLLSDGGALADVQKQLGVIRVRASRHDMLSTTLSRLVFEPKPVVKYIGKSEEYSWDTLFSLV